MREWNKTLPRSLFSLLGSGRSPELYPIYLEVLLRLYEHGLQYAALGLERERAKQLAEQAFSESGLSSLPTDEFADSEYEADTTIGVGSKLLRRLEAAQWLQHRRGDEDDSVILIEFTFTGEILLQAFVTLLNFDPAATEAQIWQVHQTLTTDRYPRHMAIAVAQRQIQEVVSNLRALLQELRAFRDATLSLDSMQTWMEAYKILETRYHQVKCGHSPERWYDPLRNTLDDILFQIPDIAAHAAHQESLNTTTPVQEEKHLLQLLRSIENHLESLRALMSRLDYLNSEVWLAFSRQSQILLGEATTGKVRALITELYKRFPQRPEYDKEGIVITNQALSLGPESVILASPAEASVATAVNLVTLPSDLEPLLLSQLEPPTAREVAAHFSRFFGEQERVSLRELLGTTAYDAYMVARLLDFASSRQFPFQIEYLESPDSELVVLPPEIGNQFISASAIIVRKCA